MIRIDSKSDYLKLCSPSVSPLARRCLTEYVDKLLNDYSLPDLSEIGPVFFMQTQKDIGNYRAVGLHQPFDAALNEFAEILTLKGGGQQYRLIHSVYIFTNGYGISVFFPYDIVPEHTKAHLFEEWSGTKEIDYDKENAE